MSAGSVKICIVVQEAATKNLQRRLFVVEGISQQSRVPRGEAFVVLPCSNLQAVVQFSVTIFCCVSSHLDRAAVGEFIDKVVAPSMNVAADGIFLFVDHPMVDNTVKYIPLSNSTALMALVMDHLQQDLMLHLTFLDASSAKPARLERHLDFLCNTSEAAARYCLPLAGPRLCVAG